MPASRFGDTQFIDGKKAIFGSDNDFALVYSATNNRLEIVNAAGTVLGYVTAAGGLVLVGPVDASAYKISGVAISTAHLSDWNNAGRTNNYILKWDAASGKNVYSSFGTALGNYVKSVAGTAGRIAVTPAAGIGVDSVVDLASGVATPGTYRSVTVDTYGRVTAGTNPSVALGTGTTGNYTKSVAGTSGRIAVTPAAGAGVDAVVDLASGVCAPGTYQNVTVDAYGRVTNGFALTKPIVLTAQGATPAKTAPCYVPTQVESATNKVNYWVLDFDAAAAEIAWWPNIALPYDYNAGTLTPTVYWTSAAGSAGNVVWGIAGRAFADDEAIDQALGTEVTGTDAWIANGDVHVATLPAVTLGGTPAAGELALIRLRRIASDAADTLPGDARVLSVRLEYTPRIA